MIKSGKMKFLTFNLQAFITMKLFFDQIPEFYNIPEGKIEQTVKAFPESLQTFLNNNGFYMKLKEIRKNTASETAFVKRFFIWFDGFKVIKFLNYSHEKYYQKIDVIDAITELITRQQKISVDKDPGSLLLFLRKRDDKIDA
jgi:hypothetical protein